LEEVSEYQVHLGFKPDEVYAFLARIFTVSTTIRIVNGDERSLTMQLVKLSESKPSFRFKIRITFNGEVSILHFTSSENNSEKLNDVMTTVVQAFVCFASIMKGQSDRDRR
jgi:hypothetical protein